MEDLKTRYLYIHFPFCSSRCGYCSFYSTVSNEYNPTLSVFISQLIWEWEQRKTNCTKPLKSVYFGGGTPGMIPEDVLMPLIEKIKPYTNYNTEWTIECNPEHISHSKLNFYKSSGINRISLGIQSLEAKDLLLLERNCTVEEAIKALDLLKQNWTECWNVDLLHAIPGNPEKVLSNLSKILSYNPGHISLYTLIYENGTSLSKRLLKNSIKEVGKDLQDQLWHDSIALLQDHKYQRYEISNFSLPEHESIHNFGYWNMKNYIGLGPGAVSMHTDSQKCLIRFQNEPSIEKYMGDKYCCKDYERITGEIFCKDYILMGLRTRNGFSRNILEKVSGRSFEKTFSHSINKYNSYFKITSEDISLSPSGMDILNTILVEMFMELESLFLDS